MSQERMSERAEEQIDDGSVPCITKEILEEIKDVLQERISERTGAQQVDVLFRQVVEETVGVARLIPQERIQRRTAEEIMDVPAPKAQEQIVAVVNFLHGFSERMVEQSVDNHVLQSMEQIVEVMRLTPQERIQQRAVEILDALGIGLHEWDFKEQGYF